MLGYSIAQYLSRFQIGTPLWGEKLIPLMDYVLSNNYANKKQLSEAYYQIVNKYVNTSDLNLESLTNYVKEMGYDYILNFFQPDEEGTRNLVSFLAAVHFLKGSRKGLQLILNLMGIQPPTNRDHRGNVIPLIQDWYETMPLGVVNTFTLNVDSNSLVNNNNPQTYRNFKIFVANYVYPEVNFKIIYTGDINLNINIDMQGTLKRKYICVIPVEADLTAIPAHLISEITDMKFISKFANIV